MSNAPSKNPNGMRKPKAMNIERRLTRRIWNVIKMVVVNMTVATANLKWRISGGVCAKRRVQTHPYALVRFTKFLKTMTRTTVAIITGDACENS